MPEADAIYMRICPLLKPVTGALFLASIFCALLPVASARAGTLNATVASSGAGVSNAVVVLIPTDRAAPDSTTPPPHAVMNQIGLEFVPRVLAVQVGTTVMFPNNDDVRHHVYSFSPAKRLELKLYSRNEDKSVTFDKPGLVVLGCNIHDWMLGYIYVASTPYFGVSDGNGRVAVSGVPAGDYRMTVWHPRLKGKADDLEQTVQIGENTPSSTTVELSLKPPRKKRRKAY